MVRERLWVGSLLVSFVVATSGFVACGGTDSAGGDGDGDGDDGGGDGDGGGDLGGSSGDGDANNGGDGDGVRTNIECIAAEGVEDAVCVNDTDCADVESGDLRETAKNCLVENCLADADQAGCTATCLEEELGTTSGCSTCYGTSAACSATNCLTECIADGDAPQCVQCQAENGCASGFFECSGLAE